MSGIEAAGLTLGITSATISIIDATRQVYEAVKDEAGLPTNFKQLATKLTLISKLLEDVDRYVVAADETTDTAFASILEDCKAQATQLQELFNKVMPEEGELRWDRYVKAARLIGKGGRVEDLVKAILGNLQLLAMKFSEVTSPRTKEQLTEAVEEVTKMEPSLPDGFEEMTAYAQYGSGAQHNDIVRISSSTEDQNVKSSPLIVATEMSKSNEAELQLSILYRSIEGGTFKEGKFWCSCKCLAQCYKVKKPGPNTGKLFWRCANARRKQCKFFVWEEQEAEAKEWLAKYAPYEAPEILLKLEAKFYRKAVVILFSWHPELEYLHTDNEVTALENVFRNIFHYETTRKVLVRGIGPSVQIQVKKHLSDFVFDHDDTDTLLIIYYAGHGIPGESKDGRKLAENQSLAAEDSYGLHESVWISAELNVKATWSDFLFISDCCYAGELGNNLQSSFARQAFEYLAATSDTFTREPGKHSFTTALIWSLEDFVKTKESFSTQELLAKIKQAPDFPTDQYPRLSRVRLLRLQGIVLAPLAPGLATEFCDIQRTGDMNQILPEHSYVNNPSILSKFWDYVDIRMPLESGYVRLEWTCMCGYTSYDDFRELRSGAVAAYAERLRKSGYVTHAQPVTTASGTTRAFVAAAKNKLTAVGRNFSAMKSKNGPNFKPRARKFATIQCSPTPGVTCRWLHLCLKIQPNAKVTKLEPVHICKDEKEEDLKDAGLFKLLKKVWKTQRTWTDLILFKLTRIEFIKFSAFPDDSVDRMVTDIMPPSTQHYDFVPPPPPEIVPPIAADHLVHLLTAECTATLQSGSFYLDQLPKKKDVPLKFNSRTPHDQDVNTGYGLRFVESPDPSIIVTFLFAMAVVVGTIFGVCWSVIERDLQAAWTIAAYIVSVGALAVVAWQLRMTS